jgi:hypothetical protein
MGYHTRVLREKIAVTALFLIVQFILIPLKMNGTIGGHWAITFIPLWLLYLLGLLMIARAIVNRLTRVGHQCSWLDIVINGVIVVAFSIFTALVSVQLSFPNTYPVLGLFAPLYGLFIIIVMLLCTPGATNMLDGSGDGHHGKARLTDDEQSTFRQNTFMGDLL